jgi:tRNA threonylcarbamoyladenosine biosynthesis protein TsaB
MKVLAIDTATERCSVALRVNGRIFERAVDTMRGHADIILPMVDEVLKESGLTFRELNGIAYGRGPGAFTGVRIAVGVVQGLAFGANLMTAGISNLAAVAQQAAVPGAEILVCMDARMGEVYWATFAVDERGVVVPRGEERVSRPEHVLQRSPTMLAGTGFKTYPQLARRRPDAHLHDSMLPRAREVALLGEIELDAGKGVRATEAQPVYLRDQVTSVTRA